MGPLEVFFQQNKKKPKGAIVANHHDTATLIDI